MRYRAGALVFALVAAVVLTHAGAAQGIDTAQRAAYRRWCKAIDSNPIVAPVSWYDETDRHSPADLRDAVAGLVSHGPSLLPFLVQELRQETDLMRLRRLFGLLKRVAGIDLPAVGLRLWQLPSSNESLYVLKTRFLNDWDMGQYAHATTLLRTTWTEGPLKQDGSVDPNSTLPLLRFGVFAIPFIAERIERENSPVLFASFLNVTYQMDLYVTFYEHPRTSFSTAQEKLTFVKKWARQNEHRFAGLKALQEQIAALAAK